MHKGRGLVSTWPRWAPHMLQNESRQQVAGGDRRMLRTTPNANIHLHGTDGLAHGTQECDSDRKKENAGQEKPAKQARSSCLWGPEDSTPLPQMLT